MPLLAASALAVDPAHQHYLFEARQMQAMSFAVHIPLVCFGIAFPALVVFTEWLGQRTGDEVYLALARRWSKVMTALFAAGVVTGTILSFELGILWPEFMSKFGAVFGLGFTLEGFSFFVEAIFIGIYIYGWDRISPRMHLLSGIPVIVAGVAGSLMVIAVNGWMNHPGGFTIVDGRVSDVHPWTALFDNRTFWHELVHMYLAGYMVVGFGVASVYAWGFLRGRRSRYDRIALAIPLAAAVLAAPLQVVVGDWAARDVGRYQPVKLAAFEGLGQTTKGAPEHLLGWYSNGHVRFGIRIPMLLSLLSDHDPNGSVTGLDSVPKADQPPVNVVRIAFQTMVGIGTALAALALLVLLTWWRKRRLPRSPWFYRALVLAGPASVVALIAGWVTTEVGRQPWIVYGVMRTEQAVTGASGLPIGYGTLALAYAGLAVAVVFVLRRLARTPLDAEYGP
ncbi:MAG TPA: cytochrome ubiquinol oxidase subunit I [Gaiellales bacterium]